MNQSRNEEKQRDKRPSGFSRRPVLYVLSIVVLAVIAVALIGGPAIGGAVSRGQVSFGEYDGEPITVSPGNYFSRTYQNVAAYVQQSGQEITDQVYFSVWQTAFYETVFHMALMSAAEEAGVGVSSEAVDKAIAQWPAFQVDGRFSPEEFQSMSNPDRLALRSYLREVLIAGQVRADISAAGTFSDSEIDFIAGMASPERRFRYVQFGFDSYPDEEVVAYGEENSDRFREINISQITIDSSEGDAESIRQQALDRTASFEDLARNQSADEFREDGGERGWAYYWDLEFDFEDVANVDELFSLEEGEISPVYEVGGRWRIYRVNEAPLEPDFTDSETLSEVRTYLTTFERGLIEDYLRVAADEFARNAGEASFTAAASEIGQAPALTNYFPVNYSNMNLFPSVSADANATIGSAGAFREEFLEALFGLEAGEVSEPIVVRDYVFVFQLEDSRELTADRLESLQASIPPQLRQITTQAANDAVVEDDLFVDNFMQTYSTAVLGR